MKDPAYQDVTHSATQLRVVLLGATGTIGQATLQALLAGGHTVVAPVRRAGVLASHPMVRPVEVDVGTQALYRGADAVISCLASRTGAAQDAWDVDYGLNAQALRAAQAEGVKRFTLLSAICVQKPRLAFQHAKLAFEAELMASDMGFTIVRPTAYFKSLSGQLDRLRVGKPFLLFGDGALTACKPISDGDLARFLVNTLFTKDALGRVLPVGGPGPAKTPMQQGQDLADALGVPFTVKRVPVALFDAIIGALTVTGWLSKRARAKADLARIGRYYATESMLLWDDSAGRYDAEATPEFGSERLEGFFAQLASGDVTLDRGAHAVF